MLPPAGGVCEIKHWTLEPKEQDYLNAFSPFCAPQFSVTVSAHYVKVKYYHTITTLSA